MLRVRETEEMEAIEVPGNKDRHGRSRLKCQEPRKDKIHFAVFRLWKNRQECDNVETYRTCNAFL